MGFGLAVTAPGSFAQSVAAIQYHSDHATQIPDGGSTGGDPFIFLDVTLPPNNDSTNFDAECPIPPRPVPETTDSVDDYGLIGFEIKPAGVPFDGTGIIPPTTSGDTSSLQEDVTSLNGSYHWIGHYIHTVGSTITYCAGPAKRNIHTTQGTTGERSFSVSGGSGGGGGGTINVASLNAVLSGVGVGSNWAFGFPAQDPCGVGSCSGAQVTYSNLPLGPYHFEPVAANGYSLKSVEIAPIAEASPSRTNGLFGPALSFAQKLFAPVAKAFIIPPPNPQDQTLANNGDTANFVVLWNPIGAMSINPAAVSISSASPTAQITVTNSGSPGSTVNWSATMNPPSVKWLSLSQSNGSVGASTADSGNAPFGMNLFAAKAEAAGNSQTITLTGNPAGLADGTYTASITFAGTSQPGASFGGIPNQTIPVSFTVKSGVKPGVGSCGNGVIEGTEQCDNGSANGVCPATCSANCTLQSGSCAPLPLCTFTANPSQIVLPQSSNLNYSCMNVTSCSLLGGEFGSGTPLPVSGGAVSGSKSVAPKTNTSYTLSCYGQQPGSNPNYQKDVNVQVKVQVPGRVETNP